MATLLFGDTGGGADTNLAFAGNVVLTGGTRVISEGAGDDSLALDWNEFEDDANTVALWHFNEASWSEQANEVLDASGNGYHGTPTAQGSTVAGAMNRFARATMGGGTGNAVDVSSAIDVTSPWTVECYVRRTTGGNNRLWPFYEATQGPTLSCFDDSAADKARVSYYNGTSYLGLSVAPTTVNVWQHLVGQHYDDTLDIYIDGTFIDSVAVTGEPRTSIDTDLLRWGAWGGDLDVDELRVSDVRRYSSNFTPHWYEQGTSVIQYNFGEAQNLTNIAWNATEAGDWEGDILKIEVYDQVGAAWSQKGGDSPTSPIDLSGSPVQIGANNLENIIRVTIDPKSDTLQTETAKLLDMTLTYAPLPSGTRRFNPHIVMPGMSPGYM